MQHYNFLAELEKLDPELAEEARKEVRAMEIKLEAKAQVDRARQNLSETIQEFSDDMTGQDGEEEIEAAAQDYCDSQDDYIKRTDPERWAEMRMGA